MAFGDGDNDIAMLREVGFGVAAAKAIAYASGKPLVGVHHIEGHIAATVSYTHLDVYKRQLKYISDNDHTDIGGDVFQRIA